MDYEIAQNRGLLGWMFVLSLVVILLYWLMSTPKHMGWLVTKERDYIESVYGAERTEIIKDLAEVAAVKILSRTDRLFMSKKFTTNWGKTRRTVTKLLLNLYIQRALNLLTMGLFLAPIVLAAAVDGWMQRNISKSILYMPKEVRFRVGSILTGSTMLMPMVLLALPLPVHPLVFALYWLMLSFGVYILMSNTHYNL